MKALSDQETVTLRPDTETVGVLPLGAVFAFELALPLPLPFQAAHPEPAENASVMSVKFTRATESRLTPLPPSRGR